MNINRKTGGKLLSECHKLRTELAKYTHCKKCGAVHEVNRAGCGYCEAERIQAGMTEMTKRRELLRDYYEHKMADPQRVSNLEKELNTMAEALEIMTKGHAKLRIERDRLYDALEVAAQSLDAVSAHVPAAKARVILEGIKSTSPE